MRESERKMSDACAVSSAGADGASGRTVASSPVSAGAPVWRQAKRRLTLSGASGPDDTISGPAAPRPRGPEGQRPSGPAAQRHDVRPERGRGARSGSLAIGRLPAQF